MALRRNDPLPAGARKLLIELEHQHTMSSPQQWEEVREQMFTARDLPLLAGAAGGDAMQVLEGEFDAARSRALARRATRLALEALTEGRAVSYGAEGTWEDFSVPCGDECEAVLRVPAAHVEGVGAQLARRTGLAGACRGCRRQAEVVEGEVVLEHRRRCAAAPFASSV